MNQRKRGTRRPKRRDAVGEYASDAWSLAKRTAAGLNEIRKLINVEQKFHEVAGDTTYDRNGTVSFISGIAQGDGVSQRDGNSIKMQAFRFRIFVKHHPNTTVGTCSRVLVVRDMQNQGATITANDVLSNVGAPTAPLTFRDFTNGPLQNKRFALVYDQTFVTDPYNLIHHDEFVTTNDVHTYYRGTDATEASAGNGSYFIIVIGSDTGSDLPSLFYQTRLEFTDN